MPVALSKPHDSWVCSAVAAVFLARTEAKLAADLVVPGVPEFDQTQVSEHLQLLAHLWSHVLISRVKALQIGLLQIKLLKGESRFPQLAYARQNVKRPTSDCRRHLGEFTHT